MKVNRMNKIGILLPAYNEEKNIQIVIKETKKILPNSTIVVVDDGSTDRTNELAKKSEVVVLEHKSNRGKGEALKTGFKYFVKCSKLNFVVIADTDRQYQIKEAIKLLKPLEDAEADFVTGYRNFTEVPFRHKLGNFVWRKFFNILFGTNFRDTNCGYMALTKGAMKKIKDVIHGGYIIENSIFIGAIKNKFRIKQVPVTVIYKRKSGVARGINVVLTVFIFIVLEGLKFRIGIK